METLKTKILASLESKKYQVKSIIFLAGDASERKYFKVILSNKKKLIIMFDPDKKNLENFLKISNVLKDFVSVPEIYSLYKSKCITIIEDFGNEKYSNILSNQNRLKLYKLAVDNLVSIQKKKIVVDIPYYTKKKFLDEVNLFFDWYLPFFKIKQLDSKEQFNFIFSDYLRKLDVLPKVFVHRDYHIDNLFFLRNRKKNFKCGWIDYQDAVYGPDLYDLVSLCQDARIDVSKEVEDCLVKYFFEQKNISDQDHYLFCYDILGIQRHLKVLGIFCRLSKRDKKDIYLSHLPRVKKMLLSTLKKDQFKDLYLILKNLIF